MKTIRFLQNIKDSSSDSAVCSVQTQALQILQNVDPSSQSLVQQTIKNVEQSVRQTILNTLYSNVDPTLVSSFKNLNPSAYTQLLSMVGFVDTGSGPTATQTIQVDPNAAVITDFCGLQDQMNTLIKSLPLDQQTLLMNIVKTVNAALQPQMPGIITQLLIQNRENLQAIFSANPDAASAFFGLINHYSNNNMLSAFGKQT